jgi:hypothetical protein
MDTKLNHLEEYKALRDEIMLYQQEMHRTWLWAVIPAGAVYTWLPLHAKELSVVPPAAVWFIPAFFVFLCFMRYLVFWYRIDGLAKYQCELEEHGFGEKEEKFCGAARWYRKHFHPGAFIFGACPVWAGMLAGSIYLSCTLSRVSPMASIRAACLVWLAVLACSSCLCWKLPRVGRKDSHATPAVSPPADGNPATSQPTHKP